MSDECKQQISTNTKKVCDCVTQFITEENLAAFEEQCGALNPAQREKADEMMEKMTSKCTDPVSHMVDDVKEVRHAFSCTNEQFVYSDALSSPTSPCPIRSEPAPFSDQSLSVKLVPTTMRYNLFIKHISLTYSLS